MNLNQLKKMVREEVRRAMGRKLMERKEMVREAYAELTPMREKDTRPVTLKDIERKVREEVRAWYSKWDSFECTVPLYDDLVAVISKGEGGFPQCDIFDSAHNEINPPEFCAKIEDAAIAAIMEVNRERSGRGRKR